MTLLDGHFQNAYVTRDLDRTVEMLKVKYGLENIMRFEPEMVVTTPHGEGPAALRVALSWVGDRQIEIIQPVSGLVDLYRDHLPDDDSMRLHHIGMRTHDYDGVRAAIAAQKRSVVLEAAMEGVKFAYVDARDTLGHYLEYVWCAPEMWKAFGGR